ncbi:MAG TPA: metallophosphoesterase, partial [bacterium (Candidatus Stahlbacteria)]|nr:metallophosphoesterase [Candidatus Stahlbacteria bacterium]
MRILFVGEIFGESGKKAAATLIPEIRHEENVDFVIANGENASKNGFGVSKKDIDDLLSYGIDCITSGECIWNKKKIVEYLKNSPTALLRPANYPPGVPGYGYHIYKDKIGVINLLGRVFLSTIDCPFRVSIESIEKISMHTNVIIVDFHAQT